VSVGRTSWLLYELLILQIVLLPDGTHLPLDPCLPDGTHLPLGPCLPDGTHPPLGPLQGKEASDLSEFLDSSLLPFAARCLDDMGPRELSTCLRALAHLSHTPSSAWMSRVMESSAIQLPYFSPRDLSTLAWALGKMSQTASGITMADDQLLCKKESPMFGPSAYQQCRNDSFLKALELACLSRMCRFTPQDLSMLAVGLAKLKHFPSSALTEAYLARIQMVLPQCGTQVIDLFSQN